MKYCDKSSETEKRELLREHWTGSQTPTLNGVRYPAPDESNPVGSIPTLRPDGRIDGTLADRLKVFIF